MDKKFFRWNAISRFEHELSQKIERTDMYLSCTSGVSESESDVVKDGVERFLSEIWSILQVQDFGSFNFGTHDYWSADWYQQRSLTNTNMWFGQQVCAQEIDILLRNEPYQKQKPHYDFFLVDKDLTIRHEDNTWMFGYWPYPNNIVSVSRFRGYIKDEALRLISLGILAAHEVWHNFDLVNRNFNTWIQGVNHPYEVGHCLWESWPCLMQQVNIWWKTIDQLSRELIDRECLLCPDCTEEIAMKKSYLDTKWMMI